MPIAWAEAQFRALGRRDARELAVALIASYQGIALLTNTLPRSRADGRARAGASSAGSTR